MLALTVKLASFVHHLHHSRIGSALVLSSILEELSWLVPSWWSHPRVILEGALLALVIRYHLLYNHRLCNSTKYQTLSGGPLRGFGTPSWCCLLFSLYLSPFTFTSLSLSISVSTLAFSAVCFNLHFIQHIIFLLQCFGTNLQMAVLDIASNGSACYRHGEEALGCF